MRTLDMEASESEARRVTNELQKTTTESDIGLDAELWGHLQDHIPLQTVYEKLSWDDHFRLRLVSKDWHQGALQRLLPKPYFVTTTPGYHFWQVNKIVTPEYHFWQLNEIGTLGYHYCQLNGIVTYDVVSRQFGFKRHRFPFWKARIIQSHVQPFETEGLILCHNPDDCTERGVFNVHTQTWHVIPPPPGCKSFSACGLMVDTSLKPYTFKLIEGNFDIDTRIYDSKTHSWSTTSSRLLQAAESAEFGSFQYSCICNNGHVYISLGKRSRDGFMILKYSMEDDLWTTLKFSKELEWDDDDFLRPDHPLGVWEGRIFTTLENFDEHTVSVWELVDSKRQIWEEYARTTKKLYEWLRNRNYSPSMRLRSFFCDGYLLVAMWRWHSYHTNARVVFNMATKKWQKEHLPLERW